MSLGGKSPLHRRLFGRLSDHQLALIGACGTFVGIAGFVFGIWAAFSAGTSAEEKMAAMYVGLAIFATAALGVVGTATYEIINIQDEANTQISGRKTEADELKKERDYAKADIATLQNTVAELKAGEVALRSGYRTVSGLFISATSAMNAFETTVRSYTASVRNCADLQTCDRLLNHDWEVVSELKSQAYLSICNAAAKAICVEKGIPLDSCSANIKLITLDAGKEFYQVASWSRPESDRVTDFRQMGRLVRKNFLYTCMLIESGPYPFDLKEILERKTRAGGDYDLPLPQHLAWYRWGLLKSIFASSTHGGEGGLIGILCIDSLHVPFNEEYEKDIANQAAHHLTAIIRLLRDAGIAKESVWDIQKRLSRSNRRI